MRIRSFHIDAFGTLRDVTVEGLPEAGAVFLGHNEAGKSTLLDFFRSTLVGYPRTRDARERGYLVGQSGLLGGSLTLFSDARDGDIRLIRRPNVAKGEPLLTDAEGRPLDPALWERLLGGVTREVYASVYGFSLSELQSFASLTSEGVRNALYGASFGMAGLKSPGAALKKLTGSMEDLFRARGSNPRLSAALKEWEDVRRDMRRAEEDAARYDSLAAERDAAQGRLAALREERAERERERRVLERRLGVWERWEEWRLAGVRLERLEPVPATFPQDGPARLERALERRSDAERALEQARQRLEQAREDLGSRVADRALLDCGERLRELAGRAASCRNALAAIPGLCADRERALAALQRELAGLGPDWTAERVQRIGRPLSLREALERQAEQRRSAVSDMENAQAAVRRIAEDTKALESELEEQMRQAADVPEPPMALSEAERERLREAMARAEEARRRLPEAQTSSAEAERELDQALSRLALEPGTSGRALEALSAGQDAIAALASEILHKEAERKDRERRVAAAGSDAERAGETLARLRERRAACPARSAVDAQWAALRRLRSALSRLAVEHVRFTDAESRCAEHGAASGTESSPALVVLGSVLAVLGGAGAVLRGLSGIAFLRLGSVALPLESWLLGAFLWSAGRSYGPGFHAGKNAARNLPPRRSGSSSGGLPVCSGCRPCSGRSGNCAGRSAFPMRKRQPWTLSSARWSWRGNGAPPGNVWRRRYSAKRRFAPKPNAMRKRSGPLWSRHRRTSGRQWPDGRHGSRRMARMRLCPARRRFSAPAWTAPGCGLPRLKPSAGNWRRWRRIAPPCRSACALCFPRPFTPGMMIYVPPRRRGTRWICVVRPIGCATSGDAWKSRFRP